VYAAFALAHERSAIPNKAGRDISQYCHRYSIVLPLLCCNIDSLCAPYYSQAMRKLATKLQGSRMKMVFAQMAVAITFLCGLSCAGFRVWASGCGLSGVGFRVWAFGCGFNSRNSPSESFAQMQGQ